MENYFVSLGHVIQAEFEASNLFKHSGSKGSSRENILSKHLSNLLPERFGFGRGEIRSSNGKISPECDLILYDKLNCPVIYGDSETQIFPIESVYAIIEAKSTIRTKQLTKFVDTLASLRNYSEYNRSFPRSVYRQEPYGFLLPRVEPEPAGFFIALTGMKLDTIHKNLFKFYQKKGDVGSNGENNYRINATCVIGKGVVTQISQAHNLKTKTDYPRIDPTTFSETYDHYLEKIDDPKNWFRIFFSCIYSVITNSLQRVNPPEFLNYIGVKYDTKPNARNKIPGTKKNIN